MEQSLDGPLPKWCPAVALSRQDGRHSAVALLLKAALIQVSDYRLLGASGFYFLKKNISYRNMLCALFLLFLSLSILGVFLVNTLLISLCAFFSFVFAINSLTSLPNNCFAVQSSTTNQNVSIFNIVMDGNRGQPIII